MAQQIYDLLQKDHDTVKQTIAKILDTSDGAQKTREDLFQKIKQDLEVHTKFEEEVFYPAFREEKPDKEAKEEVKDALNEHDEAKQMLAKLDKMDKTSDEFITTLKELQKALEHHISDEEDEMFPQARDAVDDDAAVEMAERYKEMKKRAH